MCIKGPRGGNASSHCSHSSPQPLSWGDGGGWQWLLIRALCANTRRGASSCRWKRGGRNQRNRLQMQRNVAASLRSLCCCSPSLCLQRSFLFPKRAFFVCLFACFLVPPVAFLALLVRKGTKVNREMLPAAQYFTHSHHLGIWGPFSVNSYFW